MRLYLAEEAEALAAAATPGPWRWRSFPGDACDAIWSGPDEGEGAACVLDLGDDEPYEARCGEVRTTADADLLSAAPDLARSVAHHARRADEAGEAMHDAQREIRRLRQGIAEVEMVSIPGENGEEELCPFCGATAWLLNRRSDQGRHRAGCLWVWAQREVSGG